MNLPLTKTAETTTTITLAWTPPAGAQWYTFYIEGTRVSNAAPVDKNGVVKDTVKFAAGKNQYQVVALCLAEGVFSLAVGTWDKTPPPPASRIMLPTREGHLVNPGAVSARWGYSSALNGGRTRALIFDFNSQASWPTWWKASDWGQNEVFMLYRHKAVSGWGGRVVDGHSEVSDENIDDWNSSPAYERGSGVSAFAIDHRSGHNGWGVFLEAQSGRTLSGNNPYMIRAGQNLGVWVFFAVHLKMARSTGFVKVWDLTGKATFDPTTDVPVVNATGVNTIYPGQSVMHFFGPGPYSTGNAAVVQSAGPQFGKTGFQQAFSDQPVDTGQVAGYGPNDYSVQVAATDTGNFAQLT